MLGTDLGAWDRKYQGVTVKTPPSMVLLSESVICSVSSGSLRYHGLLSARLLCPCNYLGKSIGVDCHFRLQGIVLTQGSNPGLLHCRLILYCLSHQGIKIITLLEKNEKKL